MEPAGQHGGDGVHVGRAFGERAHLHVGYGRRLVDGHPVLFPGAVFPAHVAVLHLGRHARRFDEPPEQLSVEVLAERAADQVQRDRVDARVAVAQTEADDAQHVPEHVVVVLRVGIVVEPQREYVIGQEAHGEHQHERQHRFRHFLTGPDLPHLSLKTEKKTRAVTNSIQSFFILILIKHYSFIFRLTVLVYFNIHLFNFYPL